MTYDALDTGETQGDADGKVRVKQARVTDYKATLEKTTDQSISANTETAVDWDSATLDADLYSYNDSTDELTVLEPGTYNAQMYARGFGLGDQEFLQAIIAVNGTVVREPIFRVSGTRQTTPVSSHLRLSANDTLTFKVKFESSGTLSGQSGFTYATVGRDA